MSLPVETPQSGGNALISRVRIDGTPEISRRGRQVTIFQWSGSEESTQGLMSLLSDSDDEVIAHVFRTSADPVANQRLSDAAANLKRDFRPFHMLQTGADLGAHGNARSHAFSALFDIALVVRSFYRERQQAPQRICLDREQTAASGLSGDELEAFLSAVTHPYPCPRLVRLVPETQDRA